MNNSHTAFLFTHSKFKIHSLDIHSLVRIQNSFIRHSLIDMIAFVLNNQTIETNAPSGTALLDFIRKDRQLKGAKLVCKEGECGACSVLVGERRGGEMFYQSMTSCITPLVNVQGKHVVTIEGLNMEELSPVQKAMVDAYGTQCGFCTPGFVVSLTGYLLSSETVSLEGITAAMDGNICRCTGYKGIERAAELIINQVKADMPKLSIPSLVAQNYIPAYFADIPKRLAAIKTEAAAHNGSVKLGGGTDLYVQRPWTMYETEALPVYDRASMNQIEIEDGVCTFGAALTMGDLYRSELFKSALPDSDYIFKLLSSTQIRNMATIGGNLVNASPIGDFTILLLALDSQIILEKAGKRRTLALKDFYKGYKQIDLKEGEILEQIQFKVPTASSKFHFEKVSQRKYFDIASVNFASTFDLKNDRIQAAHLAVGGVGPIPTYLHKTAAFLQGKAITETTIREAIVCLNEEISPISDARGSAEYKRLLARQLFIAQFMAVKTEELVLEEIVG